ncbi:undecaprenyldiphospho-muramoylpentapeptide beta-n-acetylglucosaminyltransferase [Klebsormidium nitens]|uniref:Undecaprenyldiphospho-muramoylpentapeptide beta-n-acetylglucosaminyltransferase n=1 Tax=Klebsormidium nitens TaxID=105231 RepID=A0A1Y1IIY8_KLENI|nr:undecaprenyldiphospho-muramoylpentapeptide beta-n-acetylglucosaminyltransferase [Klebsormidium nitens]|eukprot:GAQ89399.1 undecaprenyldiphospho-muramoylpentapeptide beta-n-acetylglucosaminyltransferase [Klebsormidium nitens]
MRQCALSITSRPVLQSSQSRSGRNSWGRGVVALKAKITAAFKGADHWRKESHNEPPNGRADLQCGALENEKDSGSNSGSDNEKPLSVLFAAGGTGGHVYPAIAIADAIRQAAPNAEIHFAGTSERMEAKAVPAAGYKLHVIPAVSVRRPIWSPANTLLPFRLPAALWQCYRLVKRVAPDVVVGTGGYVSLPTCLAAALQRRAVVIQEQNAYAGLANRLLGLFATAIFLAFDAARKYFPKDKCVVGGNPTRASLHTTHVSRAESRRWFFPQLDEREAEEAQVVLILGGSLGAAALNAALERGAAAGILAPSPSRRIIWQCGPRYHEKLAQTVEEQQDLLLLPFVNRMDLAYRAADLVVGRAGAITCSELLVTGTPSLLVPSPNVAQDHQTKNALAMESFGAALLMEERQLSADSLIENVERLLGDRQRLDTMRSRALAAVKPNAARDIALAVIKVASFAKRSGQRLV